LALAPDTLIKAGTTVELKFYLAIHEDRDLIAAAFSADAAAYVIGATCLPA